MAEPAERHFVAYHNVDERGTHLYSKNGRGSFETNKPALPRKGDVLWCFEGEGRPRRFRLVARGVVTRTTRQSDGSSLVHYQGPDPFEPSDVTSLPWFRELLESQGFFGFGLNSIADPNFVEELERLVAGRASDDTEVEDIDAIKKDPSILDETTRKALIDARKGQGKFRRDLDGRWNDACAVTECSIRPVLRASHIKPWKNSSNEERLDPHNGLLLLANIDILFEKGFVSFDDDGRMLVSKTLSAEDRRLFGLPKNLKRKPDAGERRYLAQHRHTFKF
jgi:predicted restriction endonuclease